MNIAAEFKAAFPEPQIVLGLRLKPLSLARYSLLKRCGSPFVQDEAGEHVDLKAATADLILALVVCGLGVREFKELFSSGKLARECRRFGRTARRVIRQKGFNIVEHILAFEAFMAKSSAVPWVVLNVQGGKQSASHWSHTVEVTLRSKCGWTLEEIEEEPLTKALADYFKFMESEGLVSLYSPEAYAEMQTVARANGEALEKIAKELSREP